MSGHEYRYGELFNLHWTFDKELELNPSDSPELNPSESPESQSTSRSPKDTTEKERAKRDQRDEEDDAERRHDEKRQRRTRTQNLPVSYFAQAIGLVTFAL
jgi:hypothetical protein